MARDYADSPKLAQDPDKGGVKVDRSKMTESSGKTPAEQPDGGNAPMMMAETHARHERERGEMIARHSKEMGDMHSRHLDEHKKTMGRHSEELTKMAGAGSGAPGEKAKEGQKLAPSAEKAMDKGKSTAAVKDTEA